MSEIRGAGGYAEAIAADLSAADGAHVLAEKVRKIVDGKLDVLIANAGISKSVPIEGLTVEEFDRLFAVNVRAPYFLVQQLLPVLQGGSNVIFVSSLAARSAVGTLAAYAATKGAIDTLVKQFAAALGPRGIRVNAVTPGVVDTEMSNFAHTESGRQLTLSMQASSALRRRMTSAASSLFWLPMPRDGSRDRRSPWTAAPNSDLNR